MQSNLRIFKVFHPRDIEVAFWTCLVTSITMIMLVQMKDYCNLTELDYSKLFNRKDSDVSMHSWKERIFF